MTLRRRLAVLAAALLAVPLLTVIVSASPASAHGWITSPPSRQDQCATGAVANCGSIQYEPQSVEAPKGSRNCSGGNSNFTVLDQENKGWVVSNISSSTTFSWRNTAMAFYACVDVNVGGGGGGPTTPPPTGNCGAAWSASAVYTGGMTVSHKSRKYTARWWTQGEEPGTTGEWGVWQDNGAC